MRQEITYKQKCIRVYNWFDFDHLLILLLSFSWSDGGTLVWRHFPWCEEYEELPSYQHVSSWCRGKKKTHSLSRLQFLYFEDKIDQYLLSLGCVQGHVLQEFYCWTFFLFLVYIIVEQSLRTVIMLCVTSCNFVVLTDP